jgi:hypothetical protein
MRAIDVFADIARAGDHVIAVDGMFGTQPTSATTTSAKAPSTGGANTPSEIRTTLMLPSPNGPGSAAGTWRGNGRVTRQRKCPAQAVVRDEKLVISEHNRQRDAYFVWGRKRHRRLYRNDHEKHCHFVDRKVNARLLNVLKIDSLPQAASTCWSIDRLRGPGRGMRSFAAS